MTPDRARAINASIPFVRAPNRPAKPFVYSGTPTDKERALICLASAAWYEAGDDAIGQQAVAQVVLNRVRHPVYPQSICGVVFQGSERSTGCQFTFTCDGSLRRLPSVTSWLRARKVAEQALAGFVLKAVGTATHYHTDWVVPYWSASLDKITAIHSHLFFRWRGPWGQPIAFDRPYRGPEVLDARVVALLKEARIPVAIELPEFVAAETDTLPTRPALAIKGVSAGQLKGNLVWLIDAERAEFVLKLDPAAGPDSYVPVARAICRGRPACTVMGWTSREKVPLDLPVKRAALHSVSFLYRMNEQLGRNQVYWNCRQVQRTDRSQCLPGTEPAPAQP